MRWSEEHVAAVLLDACHDAAPQAAQQAIYNCASKLQIGTDHSLTMLAQVQCSHPPRT